MRALVGRWLVLFACLCAAFGYGLLHELENPSNTLEWATESLSILATAVAVAILHQRAGAPLVLAAPFLSVMFTAGVLGNFFPFALGIGGRVLNDYNYDISWEVWLTLNVAFAALGGLAAGLVSALMATGILAARRRLVS